MIDNKTREDFKKLLEARLNELENGQYGPVSRLAGSESRGDPMDLADMASSQHEKELLNTIRYRNHKLINAAQSAIKRIRDGHFGTCIECSNPIALERLRAQPATLLCVHCQRTEESVGIVNGRKF